MKKYEKPAIEKINIGATMPLMVSDTGGNVGQTVSGRKDKDYDFDEEGW